LTLHGRFLHITGRGFSSFFFSFFFFHSSDNASAAMLDKFPTNSDAIIATRSILHSLPLSSQDNIEPDS
jgi:hypothetical protein